MRRLSLRLLAFRLFIAVVAFALGIVLAGFRLPPRHARASPPAAASPALPSGVCPTAEYLAAADDVRVEDRYYNYDYGFSVDVPKGMVGVRSPAPMPNHGFVIDPENPQAVNSDEDSRSGLVVDASYNSALWKSFDDAMSWVSEGENRNKSLSRIPTRLGGLRAMRFVRVYVSNRQPMVNDEILAFRNEHGEEVVYTISLNTPLSRYEQDKAAVAYLQKTFCLQPLP